MTAQDGEDRGARAAPASTLAGDAVFAAVVAALFGVLVLRVVPELLQGRLVDTDSYMRLVRVRRLLDTGSWWDGTIPRSNAPFGETLHWTRPVDVLLVLGTGVLRPFLQPARALHVAGVLLSPALLIGVCFAAARAARPLAGAGSRYYAAIAVLAQVGAMGYALPGRADHHVLILLAFVAMNGNALRWLLDPSRARAALATGTWAAVGVWISTEFLVSVAVLLLACAVVWILEGGELARRSRSVTSALLAVTVLAVALEHPPSALLQVEYDRISVVHVLVFALLTLFWWGATAVQAWAGSRGRRLAFAVGGGVVLAGMLLLTVPRFFGGPMVDADPELKRSWLPFLTEYQPFLVPHGLSDWGRIVAYLGSAILAAVAAARGLRPGVAPGRRRAWVLVTLGLVVFVPLGVRWVRFVMYAELLGVVGSMALLAGLLDATDLRRRTPRAALGRGAAAAAVIAGPLLVGAALMAVGGESGAGVRRAAETQTAACSTEALVEALSDPAGLGGAPHVVLAHVDLGPVLLYRTRHSVVATPYHRNARGILDARRIFAATDPDEARRAIESRGIDVVVTCGVEAPVGPRGAPPALVRRLRSGSAPSWIAPGPQGAPPGVWVVR